ncbi:MAG: AAA family ATPase [Thermoleophilaceae bacterium]
MLLGREQERREIELALRQARSGASARLALVGEPGIGKTALLDHAAQLAAGMQVLRARGVESEAEIPFASLLELLRPALGMLERIPEPQAVALEAALALRPGREQERFAVGAATLSLLAAYAEQAPLAVLLDDAHWLDPSSAQALLFAVRRLVADPIAVVISVREGEPSLLEGADLPVLRLHGLSREESAHLLPGVAADTARRLHDATAGNPLALLELAGDAGDAGDLASLRLALAPEGAPVLLSSRIARAFLRRFGLLDEAVRRALVLAATSEDGDLAMLQRAAGGQGIDLEGLAAAESAGLVVLRGGSVEFRHPLARSAIYADAGAAARREAHRALASALPDRDVDRRAWHLAAAAAGSDDAASAALEQAAVRARERSAYATAAAAFERAARLAGEVERRAELLLEAAEASWLGGLAPRALAQLEKARSFTEDPRRMVALDWLRGHIATRRGPVMEGHAILVAAADRADTQQAVAMLADAAVACFVAGEPAEMLRVARSVRSRLTSSASPRTQFISLTVFGMAEILGGDAAAGAAAIRDAVALASEAEQLGNDLGLLPWLTFAPIFLREVGAGRWLLERSLGLARGQAAIGAVAGVLNLIARDQATSDRWAVADATYRETIELARESDQRAELAFALAGRSWLRARRGEEAACRADVAEALRLSAELGTRLFEVWATAALGELELGLGHPQAAIDCFEHQLRLLDELGITDPDLSPAPELVEALLRLGREDQARRAADAFLAAASAKGQPWSMARALGAVALVAPDEQLASAFGAALAEHSRTPDAFETARTRLAYGERLRRARNRAPARPELRAALEVFERLDARPWAERARAELAATGETVRRRDPSTLDELTPQELQIALLLAGGRTTREAAAALFLSPKTIEYHLRHVYMKLGIHSREELARALG